MRRVIRLICRWFKKDLLTYLVRNLFNTISEDDILKIVGNNFVVKGKKYQSKYSQIIISEAQHFSKTQLWKILQDDIKYKANKMMFDESKTEHDLVAGKLWLYTLDCMRSRIEQISKISLSNSRR